MIFSPHNFLMAVKNIVAGSTPLDGGFLKDISIAPQGVATTGTRAVLENGVPADAIILNANGEDVIANFTIPRDYDEALDDLKVVLLVAHVSGTSIDVGASAVSKGSPTEAYADLATFTAPTATTINAAFDIGEVTADLSDLGLERHDSVAVNFAASNLTAAGVAHVLGVRVEYRSTLVSYDETDASNNPLR